MFRAWFLIALPAVALLFAACGGGDDDSGGGNVDKVTLKDFQISLGQTTESTGDVKFKIHNDGPSQHEFVVVRTDDAPDALPYDKTKNAVIEDSPELTHIDEQEDIKSGSDETLTVNLPPGHYVLFCNIPTHYQLGMHTELTVS